MSRPASHPSTMLKGLQQSAPRDAETSGVLIEKVCPSPMATDDTSNVNPRKPISRRVRFDEKALAWKQAVRRSISVWLAERAGSDLLHDEFLTAWNNWTSDHDGSTMPLEPDWRNSYDNWINAGVDPEVILGLIRPAMVKQGITTTRFRYFCWLVWRTADEIKERAQRFMEEDD